MSCNAPTFKLWLMCTNSWIQQREKKKRVQTQNIPRMRSIVHSVKEQHYITVNKCEERGEGRFTHIVKLKCTDTKWNLSCINSQISVNVLDGGGWSFRWLTFQGLLIKKKILMLFTAFPGSPKGVLPKHTEHFFIARELFTQHRLILFIYCYSIYS